MSDGFGIKQFMFFTSTEGGYIFRSVCWSVFFGFRHPGNTQIPRITHQVLGVKPIEKPSKKACTKLNSISVCHVSNN